MKRILVCFLFCAMGALSFPQTAKDQKMPVTTSSKQALGFYNDALKYFDNVNLKNGYDLLVKSLKEDPDFFMANYQMSLYYSWEGDLANFGKFAGIAGNCKAELSEAEELLKSALIRLKKDPNTDVTDVGRKLVEMYPQDINAYNNLIYFQSFINDINGELETINKALKIAENQASLYNQLGYVYMSLKQNDKAEVAFDKYIELDPKNPNVYDSKGDYYLNTGDFKKAYESYMKAYSMDTAFSYEKARKAKQLYEIKEGKKLDIITM
jgi:tetratricopeptide (TPR) repeat protein